MSDIGSEDAVSVTSARNTAVVDPHHDVLFSRREDGVWSADFGDDLIPTAAAGGHFRKSGACIAISYTSVGETLEDLGAIFAMKISGQISGKILFEWR